MSGVKGMRMPKKHGMTKSRIYRIWSNMKRRCSKEDSKDYYKYGGRGIGYDQAWETFQNFYDDMGNTYQDDLTLDRIDNNGNYCKENCRWADWFVQASNRRNTHFFPFKGEMMTASKIAKIAGLPYKVVFQRMKRDGLSAEEATKSRYIRQFTKKRNGQ